MTHQHVFISYSRAQFYFVESLTLSLQSYGITPWFDIQRIYPGTDWEQSISEGLLASSELILVASRAALASPHVRKEWEQALKMHIPIYIVLFEPITLPTALHNATVIDMRRQFEKKASLLAQLLLTKQRDHHEKISAIGAFWQPAGPLSIIAPLWTSALLSITGLAILSIIIVIKIAVIPNQPLLHISSTLIVVINLLFLGGAILIQPLRFTRRETFSIHMYTLLIYIFPIDIAVLLTFNLFFFHHVLPSISNQINELQDQYLLLSLLLVCGGLLTGTNVLWLLRTLPALHWFRTGSAPDAFRIQANKKWSLQWQLIPIPTKIKTYHLYYHPDNRHIADDIVTTLDKNPYLRRGTGQQIDYHIAILTSIVTVASFKRLLNSAQHLVCIIGTNIQLPEDGRPSLRLQWIDYRKRQPEQIQSLVNLLHHGATYVKGYAFSVLPESMGHKVLPDDIFLLSILFRCSAASSASISLFILFFSWNLALRLGIALITLFCGIYVFQSADRLESYTLSHQALKINYVLVLVSTLLFDSLAIFIIPGTSYTSLIIFLSLGISSYTFMGVAIRLLSNFFFARKQNFQLKLFIRMIILSFMLSILVRVCDLFFIPNPGLATNSWIYTIAPSTIIACFFTAFVFSFPFMTFFSLKHIDSLLPARTNQDQQTSTEPTLVIPTHSWYNRIFYLLLALEIALLFLTQL